MISIGCLIYRSMHFADFVRRSIRAFTPHLADGRAEFYFVANDPTPEVEAREGEIVQRNKTFSHEELLARGTAKPEYLARVYKGLNRILSEASGEYCVIVSSDMAFSPGWLDALLQHKDKECLVVSQLIEPDGRYANRGAGSLCGNYGLHPSQFDENGFLSMAETARSSGTREGGQFVPMLIPMRIFQRGGGFPEGNVTDGTEWGIPGDRAFVERYKKLGYGHITANDSIVYHFCEGEMREKEVVA